MKAKTAYRKKIEELNDLIQNEKDILVVGQYFLDHLSSDRDFMSAGKIVKNKLIKQVLQKVGEQYVSQDAKIANMLVTHIKEFDFYHGPLFLGGKHASFFYFNKPQIGMAMIVQSMDENANTSFVRFRAALLPNKGVTVLPHNPTVQQ